MNILEIKFGKRFENVGGHLGDRLVLLKAFFRSYHKMTSSPCMLRRTARRRA